MDIKSKLDNAYDNISSIVGAYRSEVRLALAALKDGHTEQAITTLEMLLEKMQEER